jgi:hypothetical protein
MKKQDATVSISALKMAVFNGSDIRAGEIKTRTSE